MLQAALVVVAAAAATAGDDDDERSHLRSMNTKKTFRYKMQVTKNIESISNVNNL